MTPERAYIVICLLFILLAVVTWPRKRGNRRVALPAPKPDERSSIEAFRRIMSAD